ncbi:F-box protein, partial [Mucuna pruriens]
MEESVEDLFSNLPDEILSLSLFILELLSLKVSLPRIWPESYFNLSHAMLDFRQGPTCGDFKDVSLTFFVRYNLSNSERVFLQSLIWTSISPSGNFTFYKIREPWWIHNYEGENSIDALVSFLKLCPALEQLFVTTDPTCYWAPQSNSYLTQGTKYRKVEHLKGIKLMAFANRVDEISIETSDGSGLDLVFVCAMMCIYYERKMNAMNKPSGLALEEI